MSDDKQNLNNENDAGSMRGMSAVNTLPRFNAKSPLIKWLVIGACVFITVIMLSNHRTEKKVAPVVDVVVPVTRNTGQDEAQLELSSNLKKLQQEQQPLFATSQNADATPMDRQLLARQNAPTTLFSTGDVPAAAANGAIGTTNGTSGANGDNSAIFAGKGSSFTSFGNQAIEATSVQAQKVAHPDYTIASGEFIHAILETAINSDLPGMVRAVVSDPVYGYTGDQAIIPAGSRLIGQYNNGVLQGQSRIMVMWSRVILPDGITVQLNSPGSDALGRAGQGADSINTHFWTQFGQAILLSIIGAGTANTDVSPTDGYNSASAYRMALAQSFQQSASQSVQQNANISPTMYLHQGANINVFVAHDLSFYQALKGTNNG